MATVPPVIGPTSFWSCQIFVHFSLWSLPFSFVYSNEPSFISWSSRRSTSPTEMRRGKTWSKCALFGWIGRVNELESLGKCFSSHTNTYIAHQLKRQCANSRGKMKFPYENVSPRSHGDAIYERSVRMERGKMINFFLTSVLSCTLKLSLYLSASRRSNPNISPNWRHVTR